MVLVWLVVQWVDGIITVVSSAGLIVGRIVESSGTGLI